MSVSQLVLLAVLAVADGKRAGFSEAHTQHSLATDGEKAFNDCTEEEYTSLCRLSSAGELQKLSRGCTKLTWTFAVKEDETAECLTKDVPGLSNKCAKCFAATAAYGASNCKFGCSSAGPACEKCMQPYAEDAKKCMGFMMPGYNVPDDCPK
mmetsp:Transcript_45375/g.93827  ORF Transcript_45375/g.93827 Transcript_45375/m.93827 type:complete len:152 (-) Transcript_45375:123-578(-)